jgi:cysteine desulfurase
MQRSKVTELRDYLIGRILREIPHSRLNGSPSNRLPGNCHFTFFGVNGEDLIIKLDENGIAASTGSACSVNRQKASHVLKAMGFTYEEITGSLRLSLGPSNNKEQIDLAVEILSKVVSELRALSPFKAKYN